MKKFRVIAASIAVLSFPFIPTETSNALFSRSDALAIESDASETRKDASNEELIDVPSALVLAAMRAPDASIQGLRDRLDEIDVPSDEEFDVYANKVEEIFEIDGSLRRGSILGYFSRNEVETLAKAEFDKLIAVLGALARSERANSDVKRWAEINYVLCSIDSWLREKSARGEETSGDPEAEEPLSPEEAGLPMRTVETLYGSRAFRAATASDEETRAYVDDVLKLAASDESIRRRAPFYFSIIAVAKEEPGFAALDRYAVVAESEFPENFKPQAQALVKLCRFRARLGIALQSENEEDVKTLLKEIELEPDEGSGGELREGLRSIALALRDYGKEDLETGFWRDVAIASSERFAAKVNKLRSSYGDAGRALFKMAEERFGEFSDAVNRALSVEEPTTENVDEILALAQEAKRQYVDRARDVFAKSLESIEVDGSATSDLYEEAKKKLAEISTEIKTKVPSDLRDRFVEKIDEYKLKLAAFVLDSAFADVKAKRQALLDKIDLLAAARGDSIVENLFLEDLQKPTTDFSTQFLASKIIEKFIPDAILKHNDDGLERIVGELADSSVDRPSLRDFASSAFARLIDYDARLAKPAIDRFAIQLNIKRLLESPERFIRDSNRLPVEESKKQSENFQALQKAVALEYDAFIQRAFQNNDDDEAFQGYENLVFDENESPSFKFLSDQFRRALVAKWLGERGVPDQFYKVEVQVKNKARSLADRFSAVKQELKAVADGKNVDGFFTIVDEARAAIPELQTVATAKYLAGFADAAREVALKFDARRDEAFAAIDSALADAAAATLAADLPNKWLILREIVDARAESFVEQVNMVAAKGAAEAEKLVDQLLKEARDNPELSLRLYSIVNAIDWRVPTRSDAIFDAYVDAIRKYGDEAGIKVENLAKNLALRRAVDEVSPQDAEKIVGVAETLGDVSGNLDAKSLQEKLDLLVKLWKKSRRVSASKEEAAIRTAEKNVSEKIVFSADANPSNRRKALIELLEALRLTGNRDKIPEVLERVKSENPPDAPVRWRAEYYELEEKIAELRNDPSRVPELFNEALEKAKTNPEIAGALVLYCRDLFGALEYVEKVGEAAQDPQSRLHPWKSNLEASRRNLLIRDALEHGDDASIQKMEEELSLPSVPLEEVEQLASKLGTSETALAIVEKRLQSVPQDDRTLGNFTFSKLQKDARRIKLALALEQNDAKRAEEAFGEYVEAAPRPDVFPEEIAVAVAKLSSANMSEIVVNKLEKARQTWQNAPEKRISDASIQTLEFFVSISSAPDDDALNQSLDDFLRAIQDDSQIAQSFWKYQPYFRGTLAAVYARSRERTRAIYDAAFDEIEKSVALENRRTQDRDDARRLKTQLDVFDSILSHDPEKLRQVSKEIDEYGRLVNSQDAYLVVKNLLPSLSFTDSKHSVGFLQTFLEDLRSAIDAFGEPSAPEDVKFADALTSLARTVQNAIDREAKAGEKPSPGQNDGSRREEKTPESESSPS